MIIFFTDEEYKFDFIEVIPLNELPNGLKIETSIGVITCLLENEEGKFFLHSIFLMIMKKIKKLHVTITENGYFFGSLKPDGQWP